MSAVGFNWVAARIDIGGLTVDGAVGPAVAGDDGIMGPKEFMFGVASIG